jgi:endonuclease III
MNKGDLDINKLLKAYFTAKKYIIMQGYSSEIDWQNDIDFDSLTIESFMKEYTWVVLATGLSDKVVSKIFPKILKIFNKWSDIDSIRKNADSKYIACLDIFNNKNKINAIFKTIYYIHDKGFNYVKYNILEGGIDYLKSFPFIGEATCFHLAKNIGLSYAKPDRHLLRISEQIGFSSPNELCRLISENICEKIQVVDLVIWRYATLDRNYNDKLSRIFKLNLINKPKPSINNINY